FISEKDSTLPSFKDYMENYAQ
ncbi:dTDP-4-dehydrorhamnose 3,5-epimerase, partial [Escherichia coli]|nr:dTDP-4-dehydrorhamnose 3,5-epimerase [Escherichia coli]